jgi:hypothetical protein
VGDSGQPLLQRIIQTCSGALLLAGALILFDGERYFRRAYHVGIAASAEFSFGAGFLLILLGAVFALALKSPESSSKESTVPKAEVVEEKAVESMTQARVNTRQELAVEGLGGLYDRLRDLFYEFDPLELGKTPSAKEEYGSPVGTIIPRLADCSDVEQVQFAIEQEMDRHYPGCDYDKTKTAELATQCWTEWKRFQTKDR